MRKTLFLDDVEIGYVKLIIEIDKKYSKLLSKMAEEGVDNQMLDAVEKCISDKQKYASFLGAAVASMYKKSTGNEDKD